MQPSAADHPTRRRQLIAIAAILLIALVVGLVSLSIAKPRITGNNGVSPEQTIAVLGPESGPLCIKGVSLPAETVAVRLRLAASRGSAARLAMSGVDAKGKSLGLSSSPSQSEQDQPVFRIRSQAAQPLTLCWHSNQPIGVRGFPNGNLSEPQVSTLGKAPVAGDVSLEYMQAGKRSALAMAPTVFERASLFRPSWVGAWTYYLVFILALFVLLAGIWMLLRAGLSGPELPRRVLLALAAIAFANAALWALVTPAFNTPDEYAHFTYVETLAAGELPDRTLTRGEIGNAYQPSSVYASNVTATQIIQHKFAKEPWDKAVERSFEQQYDQIRAGPDTRYGKTPADIYTPAYYAPAAVAFKLGGFGNLYDRLLMIRLFSALLFAIATLFTALFVRELLPGVPWAAPVAALAVAFEPMAAHIGGSVTNDGLMLATCAAALWLGARALRRGVSVKLAFAALATMVLAYAAKPTALGIAPALAFAFLLAIWRSDRRWPALRSCLLGGALPLVALILINHAYGSVGGVASDPVAALRPVTPTGFVSYLWQWYLPAIGPMDTYFGGLPPAYRVFFGGFVADFNSLDTRFPDLFYVVAAGLAAILLAFCLRALWQRRDRLRASWPLAAYPALAVVGTALLINVVGYLLWTTDGQLFAQGRYLFPALAVFGLYVAAAGIGAGKKFGLPLASAVVVALACTNIAGMILSLGRFYL